MSNNLQYKMFLLNQSALSFVLNRLKKFTIQNVPIKSDDKIIIFDDEENLQYKMFLLNILKVI